MQPAQSAAVLCGLKFIFNKLAPVPGLFPWIRRFSAKKTEG